MPYMFTACCHCRKVRIDSCLGEVICTTKNERLASKHCRTKWINLRGIFAEQEEVSDDGEFPAAIWCHTGLVLAPGISDCTILIFLDDCRIMITVVASFNQGGRKPQHSILGLLEFSAPHKINLNFQSCCAFVRLKMLLEIFSCFLTSTNVKDVFDYCLLRATSTHNRVYN